MQGRGGDSWARTWSGGGPPRKIDAPREEAFTAARLRDAEPAPREEAFTRSGSETPKLRTDHAAADWLVSQPRRSKGVEARHFVGGRCSLRRGGAFAVQICLADRWAQSHVDDVGWPTCQPSRREEAAPARSPHARSVHFADRWAQPCAPVVGPPVSHLAQGSGPVVLGGFWVKSIWGREMRVACGVSIPLSPFSRRGGVAAGGGGAAEAAAATASPSGGGGE